jgi:hypothetical protein
VIIEQPWHKRADDKIMPVKRLVHRWRLVNPARYRLKIVDAEYIGVNIAVPTHHVEGVIEIMVGVDVVLFFDVKKKSPFWSIV